MANYPTIYIHKSVVIIFSVRFLHFHRLCQLYYGMRVISSYQNTRLNEEGGRSRLQQNRPEGLLFLANERSLQNMYYTVSKQDNLSRIILLGFNHCTSSTAVCDHSLSASNQPKAQGFLLTHFFSIALLHQRLVLAMSLTSTKPLIIHLMMTFPCFERQS